MWALQDFYLGAETLKVSVLSSAVALVTAVIISFLTTHVSNRRKSFSKRDDDRVLPPPMVWSFLPYIGSAVEMGKNTREFIRKHSKRFGNTPMFSATISGKVCHFIATSEDAPQVYQSTTKLDSLALGIRFMVNVLGSNADDVERFYRDSQTMKKAFVDLRHYIWTDASFRKNLASSQLILSKRLDRLVADMQEAEEVGSTLDSTNLQPPPSPPRSQEWHRVGLFDVTFKSIFAASVGSVVGTSLATDAMAEAFKTFGTVVGLLFSAMPPFLLSKAIKAREQILCNIASSSFQEGASELMKERRHYLGSLYDRGVLSIVFASAGNSIPAAFWTLAHIVSDEKTYRAVQREVDALMATKREAAPVDPTSPNPLSSDELNFSFSVEELDKLVVTDSIWWEALRMHFTGFGTKDVVKDMIFECVGEVIPNRQVNETNDSKCEPSKEQPEQEEKVRKKKRFLLKKGTRVMSFMMVRHFDPDIFENPEEFVWDRFLRDPDGKQPVFTKNGKVVSEPLWVFGGGGHRCVGRRFVEYEVKHLVASFFARFETRPVKGEVLPGEDPLTLGTGVSYPDGEMYIEVKKRC